MRFRWLVLAFVVGGDCRQRAAVPHGQQGLHSDQCGRRGVRGQCHRTGGCHFRTMQSTAGNGRVRVETGAGHYHDSDHHRLVGHVAGQFGLDLPSAHRHGPACFFSAGCGAKRGPANHAPHLPAISRSAKRCRRSGGACRISGSAHCGAQLRPPSEQALPVDIDFAITGPDLEQLRAVFGGPAPAVRASDAAQAVRSSGGPSQPGAAATPRERIPGIVDTDTTLRLNKPELLVEIDRQRGAASLGVDVEEIAQTLRVAIGGDDRVSRYRDPALDDVYDVELRLVGFDRKSQEDISQLYVRALATRTRQYEWQQRSGCHAVNRNRADAIGQRGPFPHRPERRSHRPAGSPAHGRFPSEHRPRLRLGRSH